MLNKELGWIEHGGPKVSDFSEVIDRMGEVNENCRFMTGGLANHNYDLGDNRVLRIYKRSEKIAIQELESKLNDFNWKNFKTAKTLDKGIDFIVQSKLHYYELTDDTECGWLAGSAIGEIHISSSKVVYDFNNNLVRLFSTKSLSDLIYDKIKWAVSSKDWLSPNYKKDLIRSLLSFLNKHEESINLASNDTVVLHGDCKPSNIKRCISGESAIVFDWEYAFLGPRLVDIGHFLRWGVGNNFLDAFIEGYRSQTNHDLSNQLDTAKLIDLINLSFQLHQSSQESVRERDILEYFESLAKLSIQQT